MADVGIPPEPNMPNKERLPPTPKPDPAMDKPKLPAEKVPRRDEGVAEDDPRHPSKPVG